MAVRDTVQVDILTETKKSQTNLKQLVAGFLTAQAAWAAAQKILSKVVDLMKESIELAQIQEKAESKLAGVLKATGESAGYNARQLEEMASGLQKVTTYGDETILNMQSMLLTFKNIRGEAFERTTKVVLDLSAAMDQGLRQSALQVGKALEDPARQMSTLRRSGVSLSKSQEDLIKSMQASGDIIGAQNELLTVLEKQFGGVAEQMADTASGEIQQMKNAFGDLKEEIGFLILDALGPLAKELKEGAEVNAEYMRSVREMEDALEELTEVGENATLEQLEEGIAATNRQMEAFAERMQKITAIDIAKGIFGIGMQDNWQRMIDVTTAIGKQAELKDQLEETETEISWQLRKQAAYTALVNKWSEEELARREREAWVNTQYLENRAEIVKLLGSEKSKVEELQELYVQLERWAWPEGGPLEKDRLEALRILEEQINALLKAEQMETYKNNVIATAEAFNILGDNVFYAGDRIAEVLGNAIEKTDDLNIVTGDVVRSYEILGKTAESSGLFMEGILRDIRKATKSDGDEVDELSKKYQRLIQQLSGPYTEAFESLGRALAQGKDASDAMVEGLKNFVAEIINALPRLLFYAGVQLLTPATWPLGLGLIALSGIAAIAKGAYKQYMNDTGNGGGNNGGGGDNTTIIYVEGSVVTDVELERVVSNMNARSAGAY